MTKRNTKRVIKKIIKKAKKKVTPKLVTDMKEWLFFYVMVMTHNKKVGFGITKNPPDRIDDYSGANLEQQNFMYLLFGPADEIIEIEKMFKEQHRRILITFVKRKKWRLEGIDPKKCKALGVKMNAADVKNWAENYATQNQFETMRIKGEWLPYRGDTRLVRKYINANPDMYLEQI